ncbi:response regulator [Aliikangiella sp. IMCC44653]
MRKHYSLLVIDDDVFDYELVRIWLNQSEQRSLFSSTHVKSLAGAKEAIQNQKFNLIFLDLSLPDTIELSGLAELKSITQSPILILSGTNNQSLIASALENGAASVFFKDELETHAPEELINLAVNDNVNRNQA